MTAHMHTESITATIINSTITIITSTISYIDIISPLIIWFTKFETYTRNITKPFALSPPPRLLEVVSPKAQYLSTPLSAHRRQNDQKIQTYFHSARISTTPAQGSGFPKLPEFKNVLWMFSCLKPCWLYPVQCSRGNVAEGIIVDETSNSHLKTHTGEKLNKLGYILICLTFLQCSVSCWSRRLLP